jgi:hypothetical protein
MYSGMSARFGHDLRVAHQRDYFFGRGAMGSAALLDQLVRGLGSSGVEASVTESSQGADWPEGRWLKEELMVGGQATGTHVEIHADEMSVNMAWNAVSRSPGAPARPAVLGLSTLTLTGEVDRGVLDVVRTFMRERGAAAEHDETAGFTVS